MTEWLSGMLFMSDIIKIKLAKCLLQEINVG